jgi:polar amino acid transport system substrate-binding protein
MEMNSRSIRHLLCVLGAVTGLSYCSLSAAAGAVPIRACTEDNDSFPWLMKDQVGVTTFQLKLVEQRLGSKIEMVPLPWRRCIAEVQSGSRDAAIKISFSPVRALEVGVYPMLQGKLDVSKRLHFDSYSLYRVKGSATQWDGKVLKAAGKIGAQAGFSIVEQLQALGAKVDEGGRSAEEHFQKMLLGRVAAVALQTQQGDNALAKNPDFKANIERITPLLVEKPYFLIFSKRFYQQNPEFSAAVWQTIELVRESPEYVKHFQVAH